MTRRVPITDQTVADSSNSSVISSDHPMAGYRFIFLGGLHRSGTTPLFYLLRDHPSVSGFRFSQGAEKEHEGQFHQTVYPTTYKTGGPGCFCLNDEAYFDEKSRLVNRANAERLFSEWSTHWDLSKAYLLEKSPPNLIRTRFLQRLFPNAYFVMIVRHPVAVSLATMKWMGWPKHVLTPSRDVNGGPLFTIRPADRSDNQAFHESKQLFMESMLFTLLEHWRLGHARYLEDAPFLAKSVLIRYEDFVSDPDNTTSELFEFLDLPAAHPDRQEAISSHNDRYFDEWLSMPTDVLTPECRQFLNGRFEEFVSQFGYSLSDVTRITRSGREKREPASYPQRQHSPTGRSRNT